MAYLDSFTFTIKAYNLDLALTPQTFSINMKDSIHNLYPTCKLVINDGSGIIQEGLITTENVPLEIQFGLKDNFNSCKYVIMNDDIQNTINAETLGGQVNIESIHEFYSKQSIKSKGYNDGISSIAGKIARTYPFSSINITSTIGKDYWYQPLITDAEFLKTFLEPNAYSTSENESPFFAFINSNNEFNFRSYNSMFRTNPKATLIYRTITQDNFSIGSIISLKRMRVGSSVTKKLRNRQVWIKDQTSGDYTKTQDHIYSYPSNTGKVPIFKDSNDTSYINLGTKQTQTAKKEYKSAKKINSMREALFLERFIIETPLNPSLKAGDLIKIDVPKRIDDRPIISSEYFSGNYIIESSEHIWNGNTQGSKSRFIVSRKTVPAVANYTFSQQLMGK